MSEYPNSIVEFAEGEGHMHRNTHVVLTSGAHSDIYGNYRFLGPQSDGIDAYANARVFYVQMLCDKVCHDLCLHADQIFWVGPQTMGAVMVECLQGLSDRPVDVLALQKDGPDAFKRPNGIDIRNPEHKPVVFMDYVLTGGTTVGKAKPITDLIGGVAAVAIWMDRSRLSAHQLGVKEIVPLECVDAKVWTSQEAWEGGPCTSKVPIRTDIGKPASFLKQHPDYPTVVG